jgi:hypothetical protein
MGFKGTKGKWELSGKGRDIECLIKPNTYKHIAHSCNKTKWQYDMLLISKAPEMLEMLERIMVNYDKGTQTYLDCQQLIKQATEL